MTAFGVELDQEGELGACAAVRSGGTGRWRVQLVFYGPAPALPAEAGRLYAAEEDCAGFFCDPMPCAGILDDLRANVWLHALEAVDVAAAAQQFRAVVKARKVDAVPHPALEAAMAYAVRRPLANAFTFERRRVPCDMSPLQAAAFGFWGLRRSETVADPGAWVL
jgi:hypothetical protein